MDKFIIISISVRLRNLKQYPNWFIGLSLPLTHTVTEFCAVAFIPPITISYWLLSYRQYAHAQTFPYGNNFHDTITNCDCCAQYGVERVAGAG